MRTFALFDAKNSGFFEICGVVCLHGQGGVSQCGQISDEGGGGQFFFVRLSFMDGPLTVRLSRRFAFPWTVESHFQLCSFVRV